MRVCNSSRERTRPPPWHPRCGGISSGDGPTLPESTDALLSGLHLKRLTREAPLGRAITRPASRFLGDWFDLEKFAMGNFKSGDFVDNELDSDITVTEQFRLPYQDLVRTALGLDLPSGRVHRSISDIRLSSS
jgi:hypothetical protein